MGKKDLPELPETGRHWVDDTRRARLASPGIERFPPRRRRAGTAVAVALVLAALAAAALLLGGRL